MAILTFEQRHDLGKALLFSPSKIYSALYVHPDFVANAVSKPVLIIGFV